MARGRCDQWRPYLRRAHLDTAESAGQIIRNDDLVDVVRLFRFPTLKKGRPGLFSETFTEYYNGRMVSAGEAKLSKIGDDGNKAFDLDARTAEIEVIPKGRR